tara:strand:- start:9767 stop:11041 length:1275 start_codon:yes stop_codon:yes gene_type:complete
MNPLDKTIAIIGMGYVGLPLAIEFSKKFNVIGFDISSERISSLLEGVDSTNEIEPSMLNSSNLVLTDNEEMLFSADIYIVTVPTPIDSDKKPDLSPLLNATRTIAKKINKGNIIIYESTVFPGCTEDICANEIEKISKYKFNSDFFLGYSPERINPGDKKHTIDKIVKVTSGSNEDTALFIDNLYKEIITAGTYMAPSIKVAEAAKVIENTQRDINIALINELSIIFNLLEIDTEEVLKAASTKWNFLNFKPGLVGGHCIGVDPYYLTYKSQELGHNPEVILSGRRINDEMGNYCAREILKKFDEQNLELSNLNVLIMGFTFKENCPDIRNTKIVDIVNTLQKSGISVDIYDPWVNIEYAITHYDFNFVPKPVHKKYDAVIIATAHSEFINMSEEQINLFKKSDNSIIFDIKSIKNKEFSDLRL